MLKQVTNPFIMDTLRPTGTDCAMLTEAHNQISKQAFIKHVCIAQNDDASSGRDQ